MTLHLLRYNNYYNRLVKRLETIEEYSDYILQSMESVNFNPNDGVSTSQVINYAGDIPDYLIVCNENGEIQSRWFVIEAKRTRAQQFEMTLYRDVIADWRDEIVSAPMFLEKGYVNTDDSAIYNSEDMTFNQIKTQVRSLADETDSQWIVGYIPKKLSKNSFSFDVVNSYSSIKSYSSLSAWPYYSMLDKDYTTSISSIDIWAMYDMGYYVLDLALGISINPTALNLADMTKQTFFRTTDKTGNGYAVGTNPTFSTTASAPNVDGRYEKLANIVYTNSNHSTLWPLVVQTAETSNPAIDAQVGKVFKDLSTGAVYKVTKSTKTESKYEPISAGNLYNELVNCFSLSYTYGLGTVEVAQNGPFRCRKDLTVVTYSLQQITENASVDLSDRMHLTDSPYDMFVLPYRVGGYSYTINDEAFTMSREFTLQIATTIGAELGSEAVYDVQLLPYCPIRYMLDDDGHITNPAAKVSEIKNTASNAVLGHIFWGIQSWDEFRIPFEIECSTDPVEFKLQNQCDLYRLVGPNDGSAFDFSLTKNQGLSAFLVSFTYKPFQPYIHVYPHFRGLYGSVFSSEKRGLILRGDFSLPQTSNAWANYKLNNSNYENIFNRQIESLEIQNKYQRQADVVNAITGTVSAAASGGMTGGIVGGAGGAAAGALVGGVASGIAGAYDVKINTLLRNEALDLTKDQFGYQLGNIQAIPNTLTKVSAFDIDCAHFPLLEYYTCTETEKQALRDKITYNGMTIMRIGKLEDLISETPKYFKGKLIRIEVDDDYHIATTIANELNKGVYI